MTNIERNPDGMTRFGTIIRNNAQLMLHTHLKIVTGKIYDKDERYIILQVSTVKTTGSVDLVLLEESNAAVSSVFSPVVWSCFNVKVVAVSYTHLYGE